MSTPIFLLLSFLCLGILEAFEPIHGGSIGSVDDGSMFHVKSYLDVLRNAVEHQERAHLSSMIADNFLYIGCTHSIDKRDLLAMLNNVPTGAKIVFDLKTSRYVDKKTIVYTVFLSGGVTLDATFTMEAPNGQWILISGTDPNCSKRRFFVLDSAETIAKSFLANFQIDIASGDANKISKRFSEHFLFHGCHGVYNKQKVLGLLASIPAGSKASMTFKSAEFVNGQDVQYNIIASGFGRPAFEAQFVLHKESGDYVLIGGKVPTCPRRHFNSLMIKNEVERIAKAFVGSLVNAIANRDHATLATLFSDTFIFNGCKGEYNKEKVLELFKTISDGHQIAISVQGARWTHNHIDIEIKVIATGFSKPLTRAQLAIRAENDKYVLVRGVVSKCVKPTESESSE